MKRKRFSEEQIIGILREARAGPRRRRSVGGGLEVSDAKRLKQLDEENRKLKKLLAQSMLDNAALTELLANV
jgi:putative transposase